MEERISIYVDGACSGNPGRGGWGAYLIYPNTTKKLKGYYKYTTNNRMELTAAIEALKSLNKKYIIDIYTDSAYLKNGITKWIKIWKKNDWKNSKREPVKNHDLWLKLLEYTEKHNIFWNWIKGHSGNRGNDIADALAVSAKNQDDK